LDRLSYDISFSMKRAHNLISYPAAVLYTIESFELDRLLKYVAGIMIIASSEPLELDSLGQYSFHLTLFSATNIIKCGLNGKMGRNELRGCGKRGRKLFISYLDGRAPLPFMTHQRILYIHVC
jgi:hypothetical protein